jgi:L-amino acid N-acyltransferase
MRLSPCPESCKPGILAILNEAITDTTAIYDYRPRTLESMDAWFQTKISGGFPVIGAFDDSGRLLGFGTYGTFRNWPAYKYSVEHSLYVGSAQRGRGIGKALLLALVGEAESQGYHTLIAGIDSENRTSIGLHRKAGFSECGTLRQVGFKFGKWLDLVFYQKLLGTPLNPTE